MHLQSWPPKTLGDLAASLFLRHYIPWGLTIHPNNLTDLSLVQALVQVQVQQVPPALSTNW